jgi:hypothetical protein
MQIMTMEIEEAFEDKVRHLCPNLFHGVKFQSEIDRLSWKFNKFVVSKCQNGFIHIFLW